MKDVPRAIEPYFLGLLRQGEHWNDTNGNEAETLVSRQLAYIREQVEAGRYRLAGPIPGEGPFVGMLIISSPSIEEALEIAKADPGVRAGRLAVDVYPIFLPSLKDLKIQFN
jgi:uncharacterized protein